MHNTAIASAVATNAAFDRLFTRLTQITARVAEPWTRTEPDQVASQKARFEAIVARLNADGAPVAAAAALRDGLAAIGTSLDDVAGEAAALVEDAVEFVGTAPGWFALMTRDDKRAVLKHVLTRPEFESRLRAAGAAPPSDQLQRCQAILALEILDSVLGLILALAVDYVMAKDSGVTNPMALKAALAVEVVMFIAAIIISALSFVNCKG